MLVADIIKDKGDRVVSVTDDTSISEVVRVLRHENVGALMIANKNEELLGIISERDIVRGLNEHGSKILELRASELMTTPVSTCSTQVRTEELMKRMLSERIRHIPVVNKETLLGIVSIGDVVSSVVTELGMLRDVYEKEVVKSEDWSEGNG